MKKLSIVGRGTVGCFSLTHFLKHTDWQIDWIFDPNKPTTSVGEGTTLTFPQELANNIEWKQENLLELGGTLKQGAYKINWGTSNSYLHGFPLDRTAIHMNAVKFQKAIYDSFKDNPRVNIVEQNVFDPNELDSDYVMVCDGTPKNYNDFNLHKNIPVNCAHVVQCYWDYPRFTYTLTIARPYGWVFGIPLQNRCSIGYIYNKEITTLQEVQNDLKYIFEEYNLTPQETALNLNFKNYSRTKNYDGRICYNGNASFFLEPLEASSLATSSFVNRQTWDLWAGNITEEQANKNYVEELNSVEAMLCMHYMAGSKWNNNFWDYAQKLGEEKIKTEFRENSNWSKYVWFSTYTNRLMQDSFGSWGQWSYKMNIEKLGLFDKIFLMKE